MISAKVDAAVLTDLADARAALETARRKAKWIRKSKELHRATRAVELAALTAHDAGLSWNEIGDLLGIERAVTADVIPITATELCRPARPGELPDFGAAVAL